MNKVLKFLVVAVALAVAVPQIHAQNAPGGKVIAKGSFFAPAVAGAGYGILIGDSVTNIPSASITNVSVQGAEDGMSIQVDLVGGVGNTNGVLSLAFALSNNDTTFTTQTNFFVVRPPVAGTTRVTWITNVPAASLFGVSMMKLQQVASTNTSAYTITNITYRFPQRKY